MSKQVTSSVPMLQWAHRGMLYGVDRRCPDAERPSGHLTWDEMVGLRDLPAYLLPTWQARQLRFRLQGMQLARFLGSAAVQGGVLTSAAHHRGNQRA